MKAKIPWLENEWSKCNLYTDTRGAQRYYICLYLYSCSILNCGQPFYSCRPFWDKFTEWPQTDLEHYKALVESLSPKFSPFCSYHQNYRPCGTSAPNYPQNTLNATGSNISHICITSVHKSQISLFNSTASHFWITVHFDTGAPNDPQITLNTKIKIHHICVTTFLESKI